MENNQENRQSGTNQETMEMTTIEHLAEALKEHGDGIADVQVHPDGYVHAKLANEVDPNRPYPLIVHPITQKQVLRVWVLEIGKVRRDSGVPHALVRANAQFRYGRAGVAEDGEVQLQINHLYLPGDEAHLAGEVLNRLLDDAVAAVQCVEKTLLFWQMIDAGVPKNRAREVVGILFPEPSENQLTGNETL